MARKQPSGGSSVPEPEPLTKKDIRDLRDLLERRRDELTGQIATFRGDAVDGSDSTNWEEDGTDAFDREFAFKMAGSRNEMIKGIDEALRKIDENSYGVCEVCNQTIGRARIKVLPFCGTCIDCQARSEEGAAPGRAGARRRANAKR